MNEIILNIKLIVGLPHWLSLQQQSILSIDALVWRCILGLAPAYLHVLTLHFPHSNLIIGLPYQDSPLANFTHCSCTFPRLFHSKLKTLLFSGFYTDSSSSPPTIDFFRLSVWK